MGRNRIYGEAGKVVGNFHGFDSVDNLVSVSMITGWVTGGMGLGIVLRN